jgi:hypothetical protein
MEDRLYTTTKMIEITGETKQRIQYWVLRGVITPADKGRGAGTTRMYSFANLLEILLVQTLTPILSNIDFIMRILDEIRKIEPPYFSVTGKKDQTQKDECILTVLIQSDNAIMVYVHSIEEAAECISRYLPSGFKSFQMDLSVLKQKLIE